MAHYAFIDENNIVIKVIAGNDETTGDWEAYYSNFSGQRCLRTSYNTSGGVHLFGGTPLRKNYAGIGFSYSEELDAFIPPKPYESFVLDEDTCTWNPPTPMPEDGKNYNWDEDSGDWVEIVE